MTITYQQVPVENPALKAGFFFSVAKYAYISLM
jgi:hypothetical protein